MLIYEVNLDVDSHIYAEYLPWLQQHMNEICTLPGFINATLYKQIANKLVSDIEENVHHLTVHYQLEDELSLESYLNNEAQRKRAQAIQLFGDSFRATRRILKKM